MAAGVWKPHPVWKRAVSDMHLASHSDSSWRHGTDYDGLDRAFWIVPVAVELHLLHIRLVASELRRRIPILPERTWNAASVPSGTENLSTVLLAE